MLPDYIIYDELKKQREKRNHERPRVNIERPIPYWPEPEFEGPDQEEEDESERGVEILQI